MKLISQLGEPKILDWIESCSSRQKDSRLLMGPGDDCALIRLSGARNLVFTTDEMVEDTHFVDPLLYPGLIARKLVRINISDFASMGKVRPLCAVAGAGLPRSTPVKWVRNFMKALIKECGAFRMPLAGGNLSRSAKIHVYLSAVGEAGERGMILRSGARPGDLIFGLGRLGEAKAYLELSGSQKRSKRFAGLWKSFWLPEPMLKEGSRLAELGLPTAMIDNSDGLLRSVEILAERSGCSADISLGDEAAGGELKAWCALKRRDWRKYAISGGEDYGLIFTVDPGQVKKLLGRFPQAVRLGVMGLLRRGRGVKIDGYGQKAKIFEHF